MEFLKEVSIRFLVLSLALVVIGATVHGVFELSQYLFGQSPMAVIAPLMAFLLFIVVVGTATEKKGAE